MSLLATAAVALHCLLIIAADRPNYRIDYKFEKAFNSFYKLHQSAISWHEARIRCQAEGTQLLVPESLDEADTVPLLVTSILHKFQGIFVGVHDLYSERSFVTLTGGNMLNTILNLLWEYRQPEHSGGRCVAMRRSGRLFVHPCDDPLPFICKISADSITYREECDTFDPNWKMGYNGTCYFMQTEPQNWYQAFTTCLSAGGHLAIINNKSEADYIKNMFKETEPKRIPDYDFAFLGFSDLFQRHHYRTIQGDNIEDLDYKDWERQMCNNRMNVSEANRRCGGIRRTGLLSTWDCNIPAMFFCEKPPNSTRPNVLRQEVHVGKAGYTELMK